MHKIQSVALTLGQRQYIFNVKKLRNRFLLTMICCLIYHWLEVSRKVDISGAPSSSGIFTEDWPTTSDILGNKSLVSKTISILTCRKQQKGKCILQMFPVSHYYMKRNPAKNIDSNQDIYMYMYFLSFWAGLRSAIGRAPDS